MYSIKQSEIKSRKITQSPTKQTYNHNFGIHLGSISPPNKQ